MNDKTREALIEFANLVRVLAKHYESLFGGTWYDFNPDVVCSNLIRSLETDETIIKPN